MIFLIRHLRDTLASDYTLGLLKIMIVVWSLFIAFLALVINDKWVLSGILLYEVLP